jgi:mannose-1-phosphate guanylyltransferase
MNIQPVILCGGNGTRLWPVSTSKIPKQFVPINDDITLLQQTINRIKKLNVLDPLLVMNINHKIDTNLETIYEEYANDTAVAVARACLHIKNKNPNTIMMVFPSDHYIHNEDNFIRDIKNGLDNLTNTNIVLYGIEPTSPETGFGYIVPKSSGINFIEKPNIEIAYELLKHDAMWNSGIFVAHTNLIFDLCSKNNIMDWISNPREGKAPSFDVSVLQTHDNIYAQKAQNWRWSDVGSWKSFVEIPSIQKELKEQENVYLDGNKNVEILNRGKGKVVIINCENLFISINESDILIMSNTKNNDNQLKNIINNIQ